MNVVSFNFVLLLFLTVFVARRATSEDSSIDKLLNLQQIFPVPNAEECSIKFAHFGSNHLTLNSLGEVFVSTKDGFFKKISSDLSNFTNIAGCGSSTSDLPVDTSDLTKANVNGLQKTLFDPNDESILYGLHYSGMVVKMNLENNSMIVYPNVGSRLNGIFGGDGLLYIAASGCVRTLNVTSGEKGIFAGICNNIGNGLPDNSYKTEKLGSIVDIVYYDSNYYVADETHHCIRQLRTSDSKLINYAGWCLEAPFSDKDGFRTDARFDRLFKLTLVEDTIFIGGYGSLRMLNLTTGDVSTLFKTPTSTYVFDIAVKSRNDLLYVNSIDDQIYKYNGTSITRLSNALTMEPFPIGCLTCSEFSAMDVFRNGDVAFICSSYGAILKLSLKDRIVTPVVINSNYISSVTYLRINPNNEDELYYLAGSKIMKYTISTSKFKTVTSQTKVPLTSSGIPLSATTFPDLTVFQINPYNNEIFISEYRNDRITKVQGDKLVPFINIPAPEGITFSPDGTIYVYSKKQIYSVDNSGNITPFFRDLDNVMQMKYYEGSIYYLGTSYGKVYKLFAENNTISNAIDTDVLPCPQSSVDFLINNTYVYVLCTSRMVRYPLTGGTVEFLDMAIPTGSSFTLTKNDDFFIASSASGRVVKKRIGQSYSTYIGQNGKTGPLIGPVGSLGLYAPGRVFSDTNGTLYFVIYGQSLTSVIKVSNDVATYFAGQGDGSSADIRFGNINAFDFLSTGEIVFSDNSLRVIQKDNTVKTILGQNIYVTDQPKTGVSVAEPFLTTIPRTSSFTVDRSNGALYFAARDIYQIQVLLNNTYENAVGSGVSGYTGDGFLATNAHINTIMGTLYYDGSRKVLLFADSANNVVRMVNSDGIISTIIGSGTTGHGFVQDGSDLLTLNFSPRFLVGNGDDLFIGEGSANTRLFRVMGCDEVGWTGKNCEFPMCYGLANYSSGVCTGHGTCISPEYCQCYSGFYGDQCNDFVCYNVLSGNSSVCSGRGLCSSTDNCICTNDGNIIYYGSNCELKKCVGNFSGDLCDQFSCYNILSGNSSVCSAHGSCSNTDNCICTNDGNIIYYGSNCELKKCVGNYTGDLCDQFSCYNTLSGNSSVCSAHGSCSNTDNCICTNDGNIIYYGSNCELKKCNGNYTGNLCDQFSCYNTLSGNSSVCSARGSCNNTDNCVCNNNGNIIYYGSNCELKKCVGNYTGDLCDQFSCYNVLSGNSSVCSGRGSCNNTDYCTCGTGYSGGDCSQFKCGSILNIDPNACFGKGKCVDYNTCVCDEGYFGPYCSVLCKKDLNCSSNGFCNNEGACVCNNNETNGFFVGSTCSECKVDYYGDNCLTKFLPLMTTLSDNGLEIFMKLVAPISYSSNSIDCSKVIHPQNLSVLGSNVQCFWTDKMNGNFTIRLGLSKSVSIDSVIKVNVNAFSTSPQYVDTMIRGPKNPIIPTAVISNVGVEPILGICDEILIDGSTSYNVDQNELLFEWIFLDNPNTLQIVASTNSTWLFSSNIPAGHYSIQLIVKSNHLNWKSSPVVFNFTKYDILLPKIVISGNTLINNKNLPLLIKQYEIWENTCGANIPDNSLFSYSWVQLDGGSVNFTQLLSNDLFITSVNDYTYQTYLFQVVVQYKKFKSSAQITIFKTEDTFNLVLYHSIIDTSRVMVNVQIDPLLSVKYANSLPWTWSCKLLDESNCEISVMNQLTQFASSHSTSFTLTGVSTPTIRLMLQINNTTSDMTVKFAKEVVIVDILSVYPVKSFYNPDDVLSASFLVSLNGQSDGINSLIERSWTLNGKSITNSPQSNNIDIDLSKLSQGTTYTLALTVTSISTKETASNSVTFKIATLPPACSCSISPNTGYALETVFSISCPNCITSVETLQVGFVDTGIMVPLTTASSLKVPLPYTGSSTLRLYATVTNIITSAKVTNMFSVNIKLPLANSLTEVKIKKSNWLVTYKNLANGDPKKIVFGYIVPISNAMADVVIASSKRKISDVPETAAEKFNTTKIIFESYFMDSVEKVTEETLTLQTLLIYRAVERVSDVNGDLFDLCWKMFKKQLQDCLANENLEMSPQLMNLTSLTLSNLEQSREFIEGTSNLSSDIKSEIVSVANDLTTLNSRYIRVGSSFTVNVRSYLLTMTKLYPSYLSDRSYNIENTVEGVKYPDMSTRYMPNVDMRKIIYQKVVKKYINTQDIYNFKSISSNVNVTITGIPYVLSTEIVNQEMIIPQNISIISYIFHYIKSSAWYDNSLASLNSEILCISDSPCNVNNLGNDFYSCVCGKSTNVTILEKQTLTRIPPKVTSHIISCSNRVEYVGFMVIVIALILVFM